MSNQSLCVIPARMGSSRFPGKPLKKICGKEMIKYCYDNAVKANSFTHIYIATPDKEIIDYCNQNRINVIETSDKHERCTSRTQALQNLESQKNIVFSKIVMLQGDEPLVESEMLESCFASLESWDVVVCQK